MIGFLTYILPTTLRMGTPIAFAAMGGVISQKAGVNNIGIEGMMVVGAFMGVLGSYLTGNPYFGILLAMIGGAAMALIHAFLCITVGAKQPISSMAINLFSEGICGVLVTNIFHSAGTSALVANIPTTPCLSKIPLIGGFLSMLSPFVYFGLIIMIAATLFMKYTRFGFHIYACGENPVMAETAGINVHRIRYFSVIMSGVLAGFGGAMLSIAQMNLFQDGLVAGRGYLALGAVTVGRWTVWGSYLASMLFGFFDALQLYIQTIPSNPIPADFVQMIPYLSIIFILSVSSKNIKYFGVTSAGKPYTKYAKEGA